MPKIADTEEFCGVSGLELPIRLQGLISDAVCMKVYQYESIASVPVECSEQYVGASIDWACLFIDLTLRPRTVCYPTNGRLL
jgi:hypothetical protein